MYNRNVGARHYLDPPIGGAFGGQNTFGVCEKARHRQVTVGVALEVHGTVPIEFTEDVMASVSCMVFDFFFNNFYDLLSVDCMGGDARKEVGFGGMLAYKLPDHGPPVFHLTTMWAFHGEKRDGNLGVFEDSCNATAVG